MKPRQLLSIACFLLAGSLVAATNAVCTATGLSAALNADEVGTSFDITGKVSFIAGPDRNRFILEDGSGVTPIVMRRALMDQVSIATGDRIHVTGLTEFRKGSEVWPICHTLTRLGPGNAPIPIPIDIESLGLPEYRYRTIQIRGVVMDIFRDEIDLQFVFIAMQCGRETITLSYTDRTNDCKSLLNMIGCEVTAVCLCEPESPSSRIHLGTMLQTTGPDAIQLTGSAPSDPFDVPELEQSVTSATIGQLNRRRLTGRVIAAWQRDRLLLRTADGRISRIDLAEQKPPAYGMNIEASGFPETDLYHLNLSRAIWRPCANRHPVEPAAEPVTPDMLQRNRYGAPGLNTDYYGRAIRMRGTVSDVPSQTSGRFSIACGGERVSVDASALLNTLAQIEVGSVAEISGICLMETRNWYPRAPFPHVEGYTIVIRTPADIRIISRPPWWTPKRLGLVIMVLLGTLFASFVWIFTLRRLAERRGDALATERLRHVETELKVYERTRLAVELHDSVAQNLSGVSMELDAARELDVDLPPTVRHHLSRASRTLDSCRAEMRNCLWDLRSLALDEPDMNKAIRLTLNPTAGDVQINVRFNVARDRLTDNTAHTILRIIRELASNAIRHGGATIIRIAGCIDGTNLLFSVTDNGCGFDPDTAPGAAEGHFGLLGIRERIDLLDGELSVKSEVGKGTKISIRLALPKEQSNT